jgi:heme/copper-type cytochrome/quinol oxidase subunit 2
MEEAVGGGWGRCEHVQRPRGWTRRGEVARSALVRVRSTSALAGASAYGQARSMNRESSPLPIVLVAIVMFVLGVGTGYYLSFGRLTLDVKKAMNSLVAENRSGGTRDTVRILAKKYSWHFHYAGVDGMFGKTEQSKMSTENPLGLDRDDPAARDDIHSTELVLPCDAEVTLLLTSADVIHALGHLEGDFQEDATPGLRRTRRLKTPETPRDGTLKCVQLCGPGFPGHHAPYRFVDRAAYDAWLLKPALVRSSTTPATPSSP